MSDDIFANVDMSDPCAVWPKLEEAVNGLLAGQGIVAVRYGDEEVRYQEVDIARLEKRIAQLKSECRAKQQPGTNPDINIINLRTARGW